jgi:hypothetical protein
MHRCKMAPLLWKWLLSEFYFDTHLIKHAVKLKVLNLKLNKGLKVTCTRLVHARKMKVYFECGKPRNCVKWTRSKIGSNAQTRNWFYRRVKKKRNYELYGLTEQRGQGKSDLGKVEPIKLEIYKKHLQNSNKALIEAKVTSRCTLPLKASPVSSEGPCLRHNSKSGPHLRGSQFNNSSTLMMPNRGVECKI